MDEEQPKKARAYQLGQDVSLFSREELQATVGALKEEIARLEAEIASKSASHQAAEAFFKR